MIDPTRPSPFPRRRVTTGAIPALIVITLSLMGARGARADDDFVPPEDGRVTEAQMDALAGWLGRLRGRLDAAGGDPAPLAALLARARADAKAFAADAGAVGLSTDELAWVADRVAAIRAALATVGDRHVARVAERADEAAAWKGAIERVGPGTLGAEEIATARTLTLEAQARFQKAHDRLQRRARAMDDELRRAERAVRDAPDDQARAAAQQRMAGLRHRYNALQDHWIDTTRGIDLARRAAVEVGADGWPADAEAVAAWRRWAASAGALIEADAAIALQHAEARARRHAAGAVDEALLAADPALKRHHPDAVALVVNRAADIERALGPHLAPPAGGD